MYELVPETAGTPRLKFLRLLEGQGSAVCDIASNSQGEVASCYEDGSIVVWTDPLTSVESSLTIREERWVGLWLVNWARHFPCSYWRDCHGRLHPLVGATCI